MPWRSYGIRKNGQMRNKIVEMVWWNICGATISHVLHISCASMAHGWRTCGAYGALMVMPLGMMLRMRTWPLRVQAQVAYAQRTSHVCTAVNTILWRMAGVWAAHWLRTCRTYKFTSSYMWPVNVTFKCPCSWKHMYLDVQFHLSNLISHVYHRNDVILTTGRMIG